jgi:hypothetical protein
MNRKAANPAAAILATAALALLAAACSGSPAATGTGGSSNVGGSATPPSAVGFSHCMRSRGVPNYPDPGSNGTLPKTSPQHLGVSGPQFQAAQRACQHLLPNTGASLSAQSLRQCYLADVCPRALVQRAMNAGLKFARCMHSHGVPDWPDPTIDSEGRPLYNITVPRPPPPRVAAAMSECERLEPAGADLAWG